jgi:exonuclease III
LKTSINTCNQQKQDTFDPFNHSMCHCASKFDIEIIVFKDAPWLEMEECLKWFIDQKRWLLVYSTNYVDLSLDTNLNKTSLKWWQSKLKINTQGGRRIDHKSTSKRCINQQSQKKRLQIPAKCIKNRDTKRPRS